MQLKPADIVGLPEMIRALDDVAKKHAPYAGSIMINRTLEEVLAGARTHVAERMTVRVPRFTLPPQQLPVRARATKTRLVGQAAFGYGDITRDNIGDKREKMLRKFETGGQKVAKDPQFPIAIPSKELRRNVADLVPQAMYPQNLRLVPKIVGSGETLPALRRGLVRTLQGAKVGKRQRKELGLQGIGGTFTVNDENGLPIGIMQRTGPKPEDVRWIWWFRQKIRIPDRLDFFPLAEQIIQERAPVNWQGAMDLALRTAK
jgi:hypothetical protein